MHITFLILAQWMYVAFSSLTLTKVNTGTVTYDIVAMVVAMDAAAAETTACTLFVSFFALCSYSGLLYYLCSLLYPALWPFMSEQFSLNLHCLWKGCKWRPDARVAAGFMVNFGRMIDGNQTKSKSSSQSSSLNSSFSICRFIQSVCVAPQLF